jgi:hypothetical protein
MRFYVILFFVIAACSKPPTQADKHIKFTLYPTLTNAMQCVATYDEFCAAYNYAKGQRNRQWINRMRRVTARKLHQAYLIVLKNNIMARRYRLSGKRHCSLKNRRLSIEFKWGKNLWKLELDSCRLTPGGRVLPGKYHFRFKQVTQKG